MPQKTLSRKKTKRSLRITPRTLFDLKHKERQKITALTAYDFPFARLVDRVGIDIVLVGDSVGMVSLGYESTVSVTMNEMIHHARAARRAVRHALFVVDMPFGSYEDAGSAILNAKRFMLEAGADAVKLEGGQVVASQVEALWSEKIPVMGHLGMTPQSVAELGGYKVQGRTKKQADQIFEDACTLERLGAFSVVLECVPAELAKKISKALKIPTIGIGAGPDTDGQVLVLHDLLGFESTVHPRFVRRYTNIDDSVAKAIDQFRNDVLKKKFPSEKESFK